MINGYNALILVFILMVPTIVYVIRYARKTSQLRQSIGETEQGQESIGSKKQKERLESIEKTIASINQHSHEIQESLGQLSTVANTIKQIKEEEVAVTTQLEVTKKWLEDFKKEFSQPIQGVPIEAKIKIEEAKLRAEEPRIKRTRSKGGTLGQAGSLYYRGEVEPFSPKFLIHIGNELFYASLSELEDLDKQLKKLVKQDVKKEELKKKEED